MRTGFICSLLIIVSLTTSIYGQVENRSELKIKDFMALNYQGQSPGQFQWSPDGKYLYFQWNADNKPSDSAYRIDPANPVLQKIPRGELQKIRPENKEYNADKSMELINKDGDIYLVSCKNKDTVLAFSTSMPVSEVSFSHSGKKLVLTIGNNLYLLDPVNGQFRQLTNFLAEKPESPSRPVQQREKLNAQDQWLMQDQVRLFPKVATSGGGGRRGGTANYGMGRRPQGGAKAGGPDAIYTEGYTVYGLALTPDEKYVTFTKSWPGENSKPTIMSAYVTRSGYTETINTRSKVGEVGGKTIMGILNLDKDSTYELKVDQIPGITDLPDYVKDYPDKYNDRKADIRPVRIMGPKWTSDGRFGIIEAQSGDNKDRWLLTFNPGDGSVKLLDRQRDEAWIGGPGIGYGQGTGWMPDGRRLWFQSEASGYSHLYWINVETGEKQALTSGKFEVYGPQISKDKKWWYFTSNEVHPGEHHFYRMLVEGGVREKITSMTGGNEVTLSPDEKWLAIEYSTANRPPDLYIQKNQPGAEAIAITDSRSDDFKAYNWRIPEYISFTASDGTPVYARLYKPAAGQSNMAAVMFVHGAGYLQNAHKWWSTYNHEYMFNNMLVDNGYTVLDIDYRGSSGYGRDCRTGIYRHMGGKDLSDHIDGAGYLVANCGIDPKRIGLYGGSYGGFLTLMALFTAPDVFASGAALRSVTDWAHYNHGYTANILNTPVEDSLAYARSSPINFTEGLKGNLLMCHGVLDDNVHFQDIVRLTERLIDLGKDNWELAIYPLEHHSFTDPDAWTDEYKRIFKLFQTTLR
ncbi:MAG: prolyl oligopeptidase family serine peptidase [Bacteroidia bacterium]|nr:prolyl oligopeptidase family serine peptidase [Bacteroidia bacterium]